MPEHLQKQVNQTVINMAGKIPQTITQKKQKAKDERDENAKDWLQQSIYLSVINQNPEIENEIEASEPCYNVNETFSRR